MERERFEDQFKRAFEEAEARPSEEVWTNVELSLERAAGSDMRRRLLVFKYLTAASLIFALAAGGVGVYLYREQYGLKQEIALLNDTDTQSRQELKEDQPLSEVRENAAENQNAKAFIGDESTAGDRVSLGKAGNQKIRSTRTKEQIEKRDDVNAFALSEFDVQEMKEKSEASSSLTVVQDDYQQLATIDNKKVPVATREIIVVIPPDLQAESKDPVAEMLARLQLRETALASANIHEEKQERTSEKLWTSLGFAAGTFNSPNAAVSPTPSNAFIASNSNVAKQEAKAPGVAFSLGANIGTRLSNRWVVQGGFNYMTQSSDYSSEAVVAPTGLVSQTFRPGSINELEKMSDASAAAETLVVNTAPYTVANNVRYLSLPLQAGYLLVDRKFGFQLNAGMATDLFLQNTKTARGENVESITDGRDNAPYRPVNFSGLVGTELSYRFSNRYRVSLNPGLRYPFNSIYKSQTGVQSTPLIFDIGLRFRYIFR